MGEQLMFDVFLLGAISMASFTASVFFLRFWKETHDFVFFAFALFFVIEGINRFALVFIARPNEGNPWIYMARLVGLGVVLVAILRKNYGAKR
jgi:uncharacterized membrane protein HdeD (DUF308 family)